MRAVDLIALYLEEEYNYTPRPRHIVTLPQIFCIIDHSTIQLFAPNHAQFLIHTYDVETYDGLFSPTEVSISWREEARWSRCSADVDLTNPECFYQIMNWISSEMNNAAVDGQLLG